MRAGALGQVATTVRAQVRAASEGIGGQFRHPETQVAVQAEGDGVAEAVDEQQGALFDGQHAGALAVHVRQTAVGRLDDVGERDRLGALRALHLHVTLRSWCRAVPRPRARPDQEVRSPTPLGETPDASTRALNGEWRAGEYRGRRRSVRLSLDELLRRSPEVCLGFLDPRGAKPSERKRRPPLAPWLRINRVLRVMLQTPWSAEAWPHA